MAAREEYALGGSLAPVSPHVCGMRKNLMRLLPSLSKTERKLIADAMYDYDPI